ncbi:MAG: MFS transporter [Caldisphaera sp.]
MESNLISIVDRAKWSRIHWLIFASTSIGYFLWGIINTLGYAFFPVYENIYYLVVVAASPLLGDLILTRISDKIMGRKKTYIITMSLYGLGSLIIVLDLLLLEKSIIQMVIFLIGYGISMFGIEGEVPISRALLAELSPIKKRQNILVFSPNFENIGAAAAAGIAIAVYFMKESSLIMGVSIAIMAIIGLGIAILLRIFMPESIRWLTIKGKIDEAQKEVKKIGNVNYENNLENQNVLASKVNLKERFVILTIWALANYLTWSLMAFVIADFYFSGIALIEVIFWANLGASVAGLIVGPIINKVDMRNYTLISFATATLSFLPIIFYIMAKINSPIIFYALSFFNLMFITFTWFVRTIYEPILFPTHNRAFMIGIVRAIAMTTYTFSTYLLSSFPMWAFAVYGMGFQGLGLISSIYWKTNGLDVRNKSLENISQ